MPFDFPIPSLPDIAARTGDGGWIGNWSPGIGDPTPVGWITVAAYLVTAWQCLRLARGAVVPVAPLERRVWWALAAALAFLGLNKQLDLQSALTEAGRLLARVQGWYSFRGDVQIAFVAALMLAAAVAVVALYRLTRRAPWATKVAVFGALVLSVFVLVRAASFHHVDRFLGLDLAGIRMNWLLELGSIAIVLGAARWRAR